MIEKTLRIYTDGSHLKHTTGRLGIGGILVDENGKILKKFSTEITQEYLSMSYGTTDVSNPTCEMLAVLVALGEFKKELRDCTKLICYADYQGVQGWLGEFNGTKPWKINKSYIQKIHDDIKEEIKRQDLIGKIRFDWIKGHQARVVPGSDAYFNSIVDLLAKGENYGGI